MIEPFAEVVVRSNALLLFVFLSLSACGPAKMYHSIDCQVSCGGTPTSTVHYDECNIVEAGTERDLSQKYCALNESCSTGLATCDCRVTVEDTCD